jgi:Mg-chelatase subunit ChlD
MALCLVVDHSGSMNGSRLTVAAVAGAASVLSAPKEHAVIAFAATSTVLKPLADSVAPTVTIEKILRLRGHGVTGLAAALRAAKAQLESARARRRVVLLLSDCRPTDEDATPAAREIDELVILAPAEGDDEARRLARESGGRIVTIDSVLEVTTAVNRLLLDNWS